jgi:hypothetical protein
MNVMDWAWTSAVKENASAMQSAPKVELVRIVRIMSQPSTETLVVLVEQRSDEKSTGGVQPQQAIIHMMSLNRNKFNQIFRFYRNDAGLLDPEFAGTALPVVGLTAGCTPFGAAVIATIDCLQAVVNH